MLQSSPSTTFLLFLAGATSFLSASANAYTCTPSGALDLEAFITGPSGSGSGSGSSGFTPLDTYKCPDGRVVYFRGECLEINFRIRRSSRHLGLARRLAPEAMAATRTQRQTSSSMECTDLETCSKLWGVLGCVDENYNFRDENGYVLNLITGDYVTPDKTMGNIIQEANNSGGSGSENGSGGGGGNRGGDDESTASPLSRRKSFLWISLGLSMLHGLFK